VVSPERLEDEVRSLAKELLQRSPTALRFMKYAFNSDTDHVYGIQNLTHGATALYYASEECKEGTKAFLEKRPPNYSRFRSHPW
jgi:naphthoate synthase